MFLIPVMYLRGERVLYPAGEADAPLKKDPIEQAREWSRAGAEVVHIVDLDTPPSGPSPNIEIIKRLKNELKIDFEIEGHIRSIDTAEKYIGAGARLISLNAIAYQKPAFLAELCNMFPKKIAVHLDVRRGRVVIKGWSAVSNKTALDYVDQFRGVGIDTIFYSDTEEEGVLKQTDIGHIRDFLRRAVIKVIHTTDAPSPTELEQIIALEPYGLIGTLLSRSIYGGRIILEGSITLAKERGRGPGDEPTFVEEKK